MIGSSKRKVDPVHDGKGKKKRLEPAKPSNLLQDNSVFGELLTEAGAVLRSNALSVELSKEQSIFQRSLTRLFKRHQDYPQVIDEFVARLSTQIEDPRRLHLLLTPTVVVSEGDDQQHSSGGMHDSLIRLLLGIEILQPKVIGILLERMVEFTDQDGRSRGDGVQECLPKLIMNQFRWLDRIVDPKEVVDKMFEVASVTSLEIQREIISCLPEIVDDLQHSDVARLLKDMLLSDRLLMSTILDVLTNLNLSQELLSEVRETIIGTLPSAELEDLPVIIRFLLQTVTAIDSFQVVSDIRSHLDLTVIVPMSTSTPHLGSSKKNESIRGSVALILDAIQSGLRFQKFVAEAWLKVIEGVKQSTDHKVVDILVLLILHSCGYRKQVESLTRSRIASGHFTQSLLQSTFSAHSQVLREYFPSVLLWAEVLLRSPLPIIGRFARAIYKQAFIAFDTYCQQEVVGNLVTHIGSGFPAEIESSLDILLDLVMQHNAVMAPFAIFIKGVLDYIDNLNMSQIRKLYRMLGCLAFGRGIQDSVIQDSLHMIIRKQLSNTNVRYQQMGVLGTVSVIMNLTNKLNPSYVDDRIVSASNATPIEASLPESVHQQAVSLLQLAKNSCSRSPDSLALFMEELAVIIREGNVHSKVEEWIADNVINDFQEDFVIDINPDEKEGMNPVPWNLAFGLDSEADGSIALNLLPLVSPSRQLALDRVGAEQQNTTSRSVSLWWMASNFRLLQICESRLHDGDLEGIDALLGCPIKFPRMEVMMDKLESLSSKERQILCDCLFLAINWFREIINAFSCQSDNDMKAKVASRLNSILDLQRILEKCLKGLSDYIPPPATFDHTVTKPISMTGPGKSSKQRKSKKKKGGKKSKKGKEDADDDNDDDDDNSDDESREETQVEKDADVQDEPSVPSNCVLNTKALSPFLRELDFDVLSLLSIGLSTRHDPEMKTKNVTKVCLEPLQLLFLLDDLATKLEHALVSHETKKMIFFKVKSDKSCGFRHLDEMNVMKVVEKTVDLLPALCKHVESSTAFFQAIITADDGLVDGPKSGGANYSVLASCQGLLLQSLFSLFSWSGFLQTSNSALQIRAFGVLAGRLSATGVASQMSFADLVRLAYTYLENLSGCVPTLTVAVRLSRLLRCFAVKADSDELSVKTGELVLSYLKRGWLGVDGKPEKGAAHNENLQTLLQLYFQCTEEVLATLEDLTSTAIPELVQTDKNGSSTTFPTLTRNSYPIFYRVMLQELTGHVKSIVPGRPTDQQQENVDKLLTWNVSVRIFHILVSLVKTFDARSNLAAILKFGRLFVEAFLRFCMPMLDHMFRGHRDDIQSLLKNLQLSTRALHHMCGHSKIMKDIQLTNQVPQLKRTLEVFVYRVKAMLTFNRCLEAFWLGNLKNRDLKGEEIMSQRSQLDGSEASSAEDSLPEDEKSDEEEADARPRRTTGRKSNRASDVDNSKAELESYSEAY